MDMTSKLKSCIYDLYNRIYSCSSKYSQKSHSVNNASVNALSPVTKPLPELMQTCCKFDSWEKKKFQIIKIYTFSEKIIHLKMSFAKCPGLSQSQWINPKELGQIFVSSLHTNKANQYLLSLIYVAPNHITLVILVSSCSCFCPIQWSQVLSTEWRCCRSSADSRCVNYIWVINNFIAYQCVAYIRDLRVV